MAGKCRWDDVQHCTLHATMPERVNMYVYFPCMGLYKKLSSTQKMDIISNFSQKIRSLLPRVSREAILSVVYNQVASEIGSRIDLTLQGVVGDPDVVQTMLTLQQKILWNNNFTIHSGNISYRGDSIPTKYRQFTDIHITLTVTGMDFEELFRQYPMTARPAVLKSVQDLVHKYFIFSVAKSLTNVQFYSDRLHFTLYKTVGDAADMRNNYKVLKESVEKGRANITVFGSSYSINDTGFVGSFYQICPRHCDEGLSVLECSSTPGCYWSDSRLQCSDDQLLPESISIPVVFACSSLSSLSKADLNDSISNFQTRVTQFMTGAFNIPAKSLHSFGLGELYPDSLHFKVQGTVKGPPLSVIFEGVDKWLSGEGLSMAIGSSSIPTQASSVTQHNSLQISIEYQHIHLMIDVDFATRRKLEQDLHRQIEDILPLDGYSVTGFTFFDTGANFTITILKKKNKNSITLETARKRINRFSEIGGFGLIIKNVEYLPIKLREVEKFTYTCTPVNCSKISTEEDCSKLKDCVWVADLAAGCTDDQDLSNRLRLELFAPCNVTQKLTALEIQETESTLFSQLRSILKLNSTKVIKEVNMTENGVIVELQSSVKYPQLDNYAEQLLKATDYRTGFNTGPSSNAHALSFRSQTDFTNVDVTLKFGGIDFDVLRYKYGSKHLEKALHKKLNTILLGETALSVHISRIYQEWVIFSAMKDKFSYLDMAQEISNFKRCVYERKFLLDIPFIRPVMATEISVSGSFRELCPEKYPEFSTTLLPTSTVTVTMETNFSYPTSTVLYDRSTVIVIYNQSEVSQSQLKQAVDSNRLEVCYIKLLDCPACLTDFSPNTCLFNPDNDIPSKSVVEANPVLPIPLDGETANDAYNIGPVAATCMAVSSVFVLALIVWAAQWMYQTFKQNSLSKNTEGRSIELQPTD